MCVRALVCVRARVVRACVRERESECGTLRITEDGKV